MTVSPPTPSSLERIRVSWQRRSETDYVFSYWTALGWTLLTFGVYHFYVLYRLVQRDREHNRRRLEFLEGANAFAWEQANAKRLAKELTPNFERVASSLETLRGMTTEFRDPAMWTVLSFVTGLSSFIAFGLIDGDLVKHDRAEGAAEAELAAIFSRLGHELPQPDPSRVKGRHNYVARVIVTIVTAGIYLFWWYHDLLTEPNEHYAHNWPWENAVADTVQTIAA